MKLDTHVHSLYSGYSTIQPLDRLMRESYNTPEAVYDRAKARGMDLVTITDHDRIDGVMTIADRPDVIVGCEVTAVFRDGVRVHLGVLGLTPDQHREIDRLRHDISELLPYLKQERLFVSLNHVASRVNGEIRGKHIAALMPWIDGLEVINGSRLNRQNRTAGRLAATHAKVPVAGSDAHTQRGIGQTWVDAPFATTREEFLRELHAGRVQVGGRQGHVLTMTSDIVRMTTSMYREHGRALRDSPLRWRRHLMVWCLAVGAPVIVVPIALAAVHFMMEARFNRKLLHDLTSRPELRMPEWAA